MKKNRTLAKDVIRNASELITKTAQETNISFGLKDQRVEVIEKISLADDKFIFSLDLTWYEVVDYLMRKNSLPIDYSTLRFDDYLKQKPL